MNRNSTPLPEAITQLQRQLEQHRSSQPPRSRLPVPLWGAAVELARRYGVYRVAHALRLDYMGLKKRLNSVASGRQSASKTAFVELVTPPPMRPECRIEFACVSGGMIRIQWEAAAPGDWASLLRAWRETAG